jgi:hypothetical protein
MAEHSTISWTDATWPLAAGRPAPKPDELLHHKNEDKTDNRLGNLQLITRSEHAKHHNADRPRDEDTGRFVPESA